MHVGSNIGIHNQWNIIQLKKEGIMTYAAKWMILEDIMLSEISQSHKDKYCLILLIIDN